MALLTSQNTIWSISFFHSQMWSSEMLDVEREELSQIPVLQTRVPRELIALSLALQKPCQSE
jgi:hypothetical protein